MSDHSWVNNLKDDERDVLLAEIEQELAGRALDLYKPYPKQIDFHNSGLKFPERLFMAGNQLGKTFAGGAEVAMHLTGRYPDWWRGRVFDKAINSWAAGVTREGTRDGPQRILIGRPNHFGTGAIPRDAIVGNPTRKRGVADALDTITVRHGGGGDLQAGQSTLGFKSYDQGREKFQGETLHVVWLDEEPDDDGIYFESLTRTNATAGIVLLTFTPLKGMSKVVKRFTRDNFPGTSVTKMGIADALHYTKEQQERIIAQYPDHERQARAYGEPVLGSGAVFPIAEDRIKVDPFPIPAHWVQIGGIDFGWDHPTAAARLVWDRDADVIYVTADYRQREQTPVFHTAAIKGWGNWLPIAWPHDGLQHDKFSGEQLAESYRDNGLSMIKEKATHEAGGYGVEAGITDMLERMQTGRWKVFSNCGCWLEEYRGYHRKDGLIVKEDDDVISASRYAYMMRRYAVSPPSSSNFQRVRGL